MNVQDILRFYAQYYVLNRGVGHTRTMLRGADKEDCVVLCASSREAERFSPYACGYTHIERLAGRRTALAWDNHALYDVFIAAYSEITRLDQKVENMQVRSLIDGDVIVAAHAEIEHLKAAAKRRTKRRKTSKTKKHS